MAFKSKSFWEEGGIKYLCQKAYADHRGCSTRTIYRYVKEKKIQKAIIERNDQLFIDPAKADKALEQLDPSNQLRGDTQRMGEGKKVKKRYKTKKAQEKAEAEEAGVEPEVIPPDTDSYAFHRAQKEAYAAKLERIKYEKQVGALVSKKQVELEAEALGRRTRDAVLNVPARIAALLAATKERAKCEIIVEKELRKALEEIVLQDEVIEDAIKKKETADANAESESESEELSGTSSDSE